MATPGNDATRHDNVGHGEAGPGNTPRRVPWLWEGVLALAGATLLSGPPKAGKTTLLSLLLDRRREGGRLLGRAVRPGRTVLCSEEHGSLWALRQPPLDFGTGLRFLRPDTPGRWGRFVDDLLGLDEGSFDLLVVDTVPRFLPGASGNPRRLLRALSDLRLVLDHGVAALLLDPTGPPRGRPRAASPLRAFADIVIDMQVPPGDPFARRRDFVGVGRYPGTLGCLSAELNAEGTGYVVLPEVPAEATVPASLETVRRILAEATGPLTRQEILDNWSEGEPPPRADSLWRLLARGGELGVIVRTGAGTKAEAYRYGLATPPADR